MKRKLIGTGIGLSLFAGVFGANTVPQDMKQLGEYQYPFNDPKLMGTTTPGYNFPDDNGDNLISVAVFQDSKGNTIYQQISDQLYSDIGKKDGYVQNPTKTELVSVGSVLLNAITPKAHAAIAFDQDSKGVRVSASSITWACTFAGSNIIGLISIGNNDTNNVDASSATINGSAATKIDREQLPSGGQGNLALFFKFGPTTGNCVGTSLTGTHVMDGHVVSYTGVIQSGSFNKDPNSVLSAYQNATTSAVGTTYTLTTNPCAANSWLVEVVQNDTAGANTAAGTNYTTRNSNNAGAISIGDTNSIVSGSTAMSTTTTASSNWEGIQVSIAPVGATCGGVAAPVVPPRILINTPIYIGEGRVIFN